MRIGITGTGLFTPPHSISNDELVAAFNAWVDAENARLGAGEKKLEKSSAEFITSASGIGRRYAMDRTGILDPTLMRPSIPNRPNDVPSIQCEMSIAAAQEAMKQAGVEAGDIGAVILACSNQQRSYPALAVEVQDALGT
jgi:beta-ketodecanoyl-[acyl-carrier-protein] synthase